MKRVGILISGGGSNMVALAKDMVGDHPGRAKLVIANDPGAGGLLKANALRIPTAVVDHRDFPKDREGFEAELQVVLEEAGIEMIALAGFMRILTPGFTAKWAGRMLNIHPSLLPKYKGLQTHARALEAGDAQHGCSVHEVTADLDDGPILGQARMDVRAGDTPQSLAERLLPLEHQLYPAVLRRYLAGDRTPVMLEG
ncbi:formyltetrahydrofolate-dependent phosphoribosylglycinamide formyltransferase [Loktanella salsilacus]|uniref:Phosphoribosylglycinamide formyltransferase n=1 Tax=Loktanella salsilacus TaxID=195913 RepID=A0A1I4J6G3_9RHOB|nr:phosphoribosylglycinamide formyltransferase [Loktanella salsilacus]SFL61676.1 formyltetrahydrofolate-dependent phosphoribosylglycinamide formyltransferase [Loktanella salsilacus]